MHDMVVERLQNGDVDAFGDLYELYFSKIYRFIYYKTLDQAVAEDITEETFLKALKNRKSFHGSTASEFSSWLYAIAYNACVDHFRNQEDTTDVDESSEELGFSEDTAGDLDNRSKIEEILAFLDTFPTEQKDIIIMRVWDELSYEEIAAITGKSQENCRKIVSRGLTAIQSNITYLIAFCLIQQYFQ